MIAGLSVLYRFAADRDWPRWNWASPGAIVATIIWLAASIGFAIYTTNFGKYNETYGALGAIVVVMLWLYIGAYAVIAGAELNGELEHQTAHDTTRGRPEPMGTRDALRGRHDRRDRPGGQRHRDPNGAAFSPDYGTAPAGADATLWMPTLLIRVVEQAQVVDGPGLRPVSGGLGTP